MPAAATITTRFAATKALVCVSCLGKLAYRDRLLCQGCTRTYDVVDGIPCFSTPDAFYDSYAQEHCPFAASPRGLKNLILRILPFWSWREWDFWRRAIPRCDRMLDFGCGRGREVFVRKSNEIVGYDGSMAFLRDCALRYSSVALGQLPRLPFESGYFDVVASSHTIGHVGFDQKDELISEISRVLKPGGVTAHIIETDSDHPAVQAAKRYPEAFRKQFIEQHGHIGLEPATRVLERFRIHGFQVTTCRLVDAIIPSVLNYRRFFGVPQLAELPELNWSRRLSLWCSASPVFNAGYEVMFGAFHRTIEQWFGDADKAQFMLVSFVKRS